MKEMDIAILLFYLLLAVFTIAVIIGFTHLSEISSIAFTIR